MFFDMRVSKMFFFSFFLVKSEFRLFFSKINFLIKNSEMLSEYCSYKCLQMKKIAINVIGNAAKNFQVLLRVPRGKLSLAPPIMLPGTFFPTDSDFWVPWGKT